MHTCTHTYTHTHTNTHTHTHTHIQTHKQAGTHTEVDFSEQLFVTDYSGFP